MANRFTNKKDYDQQEYLDRSFKINNSYTDYFMAALALSAAALAKTENEITLAMWIASRDQYHIGSGCVGFDIGDIPWSKKAFDEQMSLMLRVVAATKSANYFDYHRLLY